MLLLSIFVVVGSSTIFYTKMINIFIFNKHFTFTKVTIHPGSGKHMSLIVQVVVSVKVNTTV